MRSFSEIWNRYPLRWKIAFGFIALILIGLSTRSWIFTILAWLIIIVMIVKLILDFEVF